jgi:hypothetical protein
MSSYTTKFSLNDTAYFVDSVSLNVVSGVVSAVYITHTTMATAIIAYGLTFPTTSTRSRTKYNETDLYYLEEAKAQALELLSQRTSDIESLR